MDRVRDGKGDKRCGGGGGVFLGIVLSEKGKG